MLEIEVELVLCVLIMLIRGKRKLRGEERENNKKRKTVDSSTAPGMASRSHVPPLFSVKKEKEISFG